MESVGKKACYFFIVADIFIVAAKICEIMFKCSAGEQGCGDCNHMKEMWIAVGFYVDFGVESVLKSVSYLTRMEKHTTLSLQICYVTMVNFH